MSSRACHHHAACWPFKDAHLLPIPAAQCDSPVNRHPDRKTGGGSDLRSLIMLDGRNTDRGRPVERLYAARHDKVTLTVTRTRAMAQDGVPASCRIIGCPTDGTLPVGEIR